jgi:signal transduction histidine kinase
MGTQSATRMAIASPSVRQKDPSRALFGEDDSTPNLVHDLKGPLSAVSMNVDFVLDQLPRDEKFDVIRAALHDCRHASGRLLRMVANLLDVAKIERGHLALTIAPVDLSAVLKKAGDEYAAEAEMRDVKLRIELEVGLGSIDADAEILLRVVQNLIESSLRYMRSAGNILIAARQATSHVEIIIANDGHPIAEEDEADLFEKRAGMTATTDTSVTSRIGLYFCRHTINSMGGALTLEKTREYATCFVIRLPTPIPSTIP